MKKFSNWVVNHYKLIVITSVLLLIPAFYGFIKTRINYDILVYLPESVETIKGENILTDDFGIGSYAFVMIDNMSSKNIKALEDDIKKIAGVNEVLSVVDLLDTGVPTSMLPKRVYDKLYEDKETIIVVTFDGSTSEDKTLEALATLREKVGDASKISSMSAMVMDTRDLSDKEMAIYIVIGVLLCMLVLIIATDSYIIPILLLGNIGFAIIYNMGTNIIFGEISYITKAITAILQLGVTTDFSIFLYHKYEEAIKENTNRNSAMAEAITKTFKSVIGSSLTTFAGFLALCTMDLTLGTDIGLVMAKGVIWGLICVLTLFPALILIFDKVINKTKHKVIFPSFKHISNFSVKHYKAILGVFVLLLIPVIIGNKNVEVYYKLDESLPNDMPFKLANKELAEKFNIISPEIILLDKNLKNADVNLLKERLEALEGIDFVLTPSTILNEGVVSLLPPDLANIINNDTYKLMIASSIYEIASPKLNEQLEEVEKIVKGVDDKSIIAGEGALMKDLVNIADHDFKMVNYTSVGVIFVIMILVLHSISLPIILILTIEFAIFTNMAIAYYTGTTLPFIASIVVGTIQLGATVDYAILMSTRYIEERASKDKKAAISATLKGTIPSIITSALCFFSATFGVFLFTKIDMIGSICELLARGSIISMLVVILILPALLMVSDKIIYKKKEGKRMKKLEKINNKKVLASIIAFSLFIPLNAKALTKDEVVYANLNELGETSGVIVNNHIKVNSDETLEDDSILQNILNISGHEEYMRRENKLLWQTNNKDIVYQGTTDKELPITTKVRYYLNDEEMKVNDMIGKNGKVSIVYEFTNNSFSYQNSKKLYTPFVVALGTILNSEEKNITVTNGKVVNTGSRNLVVSLAAPGLYESMNLNELKSLNKIVLTYETTNFNYQEAYMVITPKLLSEMDLDIFNKLDTLNNKMNILQEGMNELETGAESLATGSKALQDGSNVLTTNLKNAIDAINKLEAGSNTLDESLKAIIKELESAKVELENGNNNDSIASIKKLIKTNEATITSLKSIKNTYDEHNLNSFPTIEDLQNYLTNNGIDSDTIIKLVNVKITYEDIVYQNTVVSLIPLLEGNNTALKSTLLTLEKIENNINSTLTTLYKVLQEVESGAASIYNGLSELKEGIKKLYTGSNTIYEGTITLTNGINSLNDGIKKINEEGILTLVDYTSKASGYANTLESLIKLSKEYKGYSSNNITNSTFIYKIAMN